MALSPLEASTMLASGVIPGDAFVLPRALRIMFIGDSLPAGRGAPSVATGGAVQMDGARAMSYPTKLRDALLAAGFPASSESWAEANNTGGTLPGYDPRATMGSWTVSAGRTIGGLTLTSTGAGAQFVFTPSTPVDTFELYLPNNGFGTATYSIDGGAPVTISEAGAAALNKVVVTTTLGMHSIAFNWATASFFLCPMVAYNSKAKEFRIINMGARNWSTTDWVTQDALWRPLPAIGTYAPDISLISLGVNDGRLSGAGNSIATFTTNMQTIITKALTVGKVGLVTPPTIDPAQEGSFTYGQMMTAYQQLADANNLPVFHTERLLGSWDDGVIAGTALNDGLHRSGPAYSSMGAGLVDFVVSIARTIQ